MRSTPKRGVGPLIPPSPARHRSTKKAVAAEPLTEEIHSSDPHHLVWRYTMSDTIHVSGKRIAPTAIVTAFKLNGSEVTWLREVALVMHADELFTLRMNRWPDWAPIPAWEFLRQAIREAEQDEAFAQGAIA